MFFVFNVTPDLKVRAIKGCPLSHLCHFEGAPA